MKIGTELRKIWTICHCMCCLNSSTISLWTLSIWPCNTQNSMLSCKYWLELRHVILLLFKYCSYLSSKQQWFELWFRLILYIPVNSYGHVQMVSSTNHTFFLSKLDLAVNKYFVHILSLITDNNSSWTSGREVNDHRNYFMINLRESKGPGRYQTRNPWICSRVLHQVECLGVPGTQLWLWWGSHHWKRGSHLFI